MKWVEGLRIATVACLAMHGAHAATNIYGIRGTTVAGVNNILRIDGATGATTTVYTNYPGGDAASMAQCPNGLIYYAINASPYQLYVFNPQTPTVAPTTLGSGLGAAAVRMACSPTGVLYYMLDAATSNLFTINTATGALSGTSATILLGGTGGDIAFNSTGTLYLLNSSTNSLWTIPTGGGTVNGIGSGLGPVSGLNGAPIGLAFDASDNPRVLTNGSPNFYSTSGGSPVATSIATLPGGISNGDLASIAVANPDLSITVTASVANVVPATATSVVYTVVVSNASGYAVTGTIVDTFPAGIVANSWTCTPSAGSSCGATSGSGNIATTATLAVSGTATYTINATVTATTDLTNTATVALPFAYLVDATPANNTASAVVLVRPSVSATFGAASLTINTATTLTLAIANPDSTAITLSSAFTDTLPTTPAAMTIATAGNTGTCTGVTATAGAGALTMASGTSIPSGGCTIVASVRSSQPGSDTNTIAVGQLATSAGSNAVAANATVVFLGPTFTMVKSSTVFSDPFNNTSNPKAIPGGVMTYTMQITNTGPASPDTNTVVVVDAVPTNTALYVGDLGSPSGPVAFAPQTSGLTYTYVSLASTTDDVSFSNVDCVTFTYTPVPDGTGFDAAVKCLRVNPKGVFATNVGTPPGFQLQFRVRIN